MRDTVVPTFKSHAAPAKGQDGSLVCNMRPRKINIADWDPLLNQCLDAAKRFIEDRL